MFNKIILVTLVLFIGLQSHTAQGISEQYDLRPIDEININNYSDAYPWISDDGLRLYFCGNDNSQNLSTIFISSRNNSDHSFDEPRELNINFPNASNYSPYLLQDELTIVFAARVPHGMISTSIYIATRNHINEDFSLPEKLEIIGKVRGDLISPSLTPDLKELYLFNEYNYQQSILKLVRTGKNTYHLANRFVLEKGNRIKSGKLSSDGLDLFLSLEKHSSLPSIHIMSRDHLGTEFLTMKKLEHDILNNPEFRNHQPYFSTNKNFMVFARSDHNEWSRNNLYIAQAKKVYSENHNTAGQIIVEVYPNPSNGIMKIASETNLSSFEIEVFSMSGSKVYTTNLEGKDSSINLKFLRSGHYLIRIFNETHKLVTTKLIQLIDP